MTKPLNLEAAAHLTGATARAVASSVQHDKRVAQLRAVTGLREEPARLWLQIINGLGRSTVIAADRLAEEFVRRVAGGENPLDAAAGMAANLGARI